MLKEEERRPEAGAEGAVGRWGRWCLNEDDCAVSCGPGCGLDFNSAQDRPQGLALSRGGMACPALGAEDRSDCCVESRVGGRPRRGPSCSRLFSGALSVPVAVVGSGHILQ